MVYGARHVERSLRCRLDRILPLHAVIRHRWAVALAAAVLLATPLAVLMPQDIAGSAAISFAAPFSSIGDEQVVLALLPEQTPLYLGQRLRVDIVVRTTQPVDGVAAHIRFDPELLKVAEIGVGEALPLAIQNTIDPENGRIHLAHGALGEPFPRADFVVSTVIFTATGITAGTPLTLLAVPPFLSDVTFGGVSILDAREQVDIAILPVPTPTPTPTPTPVGVPSSTPTGTPPPPTPTNTPTTTPASVASPTPAGTPTPVGVPSSTPTGTPPPPTPTDTPTTTPASIASPTPAGTPTPVTTPSARLRLARLEPSQGVAGVSNEVRIIGAGLTPGSTVAVAGVALENFTITDAQGMQAAATVPTGLAAGLYTVEAASPGGATSVLPGGYSVIDAAAADLAVTDGDLWFDPATVRQGAPALIGVNVHRSGGTQLLSDVTVHFYLDAIDSGGLLGAATLPPLAPGVDVVDVAFVAWTPLAAGSHVLYAVVDPDEVVDEGSEANNRAEWAFNVLPAAAQADTTSPVITQLAIAGGAHSTESLDIPLQLAAGDDASGVTSMYLVERAYNNAARLWVPLQQSGWVTYSTPYTFTLTPTGGVHYLQAWVADAAGNISTRSHRAAVNYLPEQENVRTGQVRTYRLDLQAGDLLRAHLTALAGDPDLYIWNEAGMLVGYSNAFDLAPEAVELVAMHAGVYQIEVYGYIDSRYRLALNPGAAYGAAPALQTDAKVPPASPIVSPAAVPPGQQALPTAPGEAVPDAGAQLYLPAIRR